MKSQFHIPDHSPAAISEGYDAALIRAAFAKLEANEMRQYRDEIKSAARPRPDHSATIRSLRRKVRARKTHEFLTHHLPRAAQLAACLIGILAIGTGVAFAASSAARQWAAGVLVGSEPVIDEADGFAAWYTYYDGFVDGVRLNDAACLLDQNNQTIRILESTDAEPRLYQPAEANDLSMRAMVTNGQDVYLLCHREPEYDSGEGRYIGENVFALARVDFSEDGLYRLETVFERSINELLDIPSDRYCYLCGDAAACADGRLYFTAAASAAAADAKPRLLSFDPASGAVSEIALPAQIGTPMFDIIQIFCGSEGRLHMVRNTAEDGTPPNLVYRLGDDGSFTRIGDVGSSAFGFAYRFSDDSVIYAENGGIYRAPGGDFANAERVGITAETEGTGLIVGENGYMLVNADHAKVFDLSADLSGAVELVVDGDGGYGSGIAKALNEENPNITVREGDSWRYADYAQSIPDGVDVWILNKTSFRRFVESGHCAPIDDEALEEMIDKLSPGAERIFRDEAGRLIAIPFSNYNIRGDFSFNAKLWADLGVARDQLPDTWEEFLKLMIDLSHSEGARKYLVYQPWAHDDESPAVEAARSMFTTMANAYGRNRSAQGLPVDYSDESFRALVELFRQIDFSALRYPAEGEGTSSSEILVARYTGYSSISFHEDNELYEVTLKFSEDGPRISEMYGDFAVIDPNTAHGTEALRYLELIAENYSLSERDIMFGEIIYEDCDTPELRQRMRDMIGTIDTFSIDDWGDHTRADAACDAAAAYFAGEVDYAAFAQRMNALAAQ